MPEKFAEHGSKVLRQIFKDKPYQGQTPSQSKIVFLGRDANYPKDIETRPKCFELLLQYHEDGVGFWENKYGNNPDNKHHPFLICMQNGDPGYKYHKVFSDMKLDSSYAKHISFVELLDLPTMGDPDEDPDGAFDGLLKNSKIHLEQLLHHLLGNRKRAVFVPNSAIIHMKNISASFMFYEGIYKKNRPIRAECPLLIFQYKNIDVYKCYHFSDSRGGAQLEHMKTLVNKYI